MMDASEDCPAMAVATNFVPFPHFRISFGGLSNEPALDFRLLDRDFEDPVLRPALS